MKRFVSGGVPSVLGAARMASLVVVVVFIGGCGGEEAPGSPVDEAAGQDVAEQELEPAETTQSAETSVASIGEPVTVGDVRWTVTDVKQTDEVVSRFGSEEGDFAVVDVTFENNSNQDIRLATPLISLVDSEGREFEPDIEDSFFHVFQEENMFVGRVEPGATKEGKVIFRVAPDSSEVRLQVGEARFASDETGYISLGF